VATIPLESEPYQPLLSPNHSRLYVANSRSSSICMIDTKTNTLNVTIDPGNNRLRNSPLRSMAITSDGGRLYVTYEDSRWISLVDTVTYNVKNVQLGDSLREVVFVKWK
jgi:YVTN family beta-propeller protein